MRKKFQRLSKTSKSRKNLRKNTKKQIRKQKKTKKTNQKAGMFGGPSSLGPRRQSARPPHLNQNMYRLAIQYLDDLLNTYRIYQDILQEFDIKTAAISPPPPWRSSRHPYDGNTLKIEITKNGIGTRYHIKDYRDLHGAIHTGDSPLRNYGIEKLGRQKQDIIVCANFDFKKYEELSQKVYLCLLKLQKAKREYPQFVMYAIIKSNIPNIIKSIITPVSDAIRQGRRNKYNQVVGAQNQNAQDVLKVVQARRATILQEAGNRNAENMNFMAKCIQVASALLLPHREFEPIVTKNGNQEIVCEGFPVGFGGGNLFVEFGDLEDILKFDVHIMQHIHQDLVKVISKCKLFFAAQDSRGQPLPGPARLRKRNLQDTIDPKKLEDLKSGPYYTYQRAKNLTQNISYDELYKKYHPPLVIPQDLKTLLNHDDLTVDPNTLRKRGAHRRVGNDPNYHDNEYYYAARTGSESSNNQFYDALTGSEQN